MSNEKDKILKTAIQLADMSVKSPTIDKNSRTWVKFGSNNNFPNDLISMVKESPLQSAILNNQFVYACGAGFEDWEGEIYTPNLIHNWEELTRRCLRDYTFLQSFAIQAILNEDGKTYSYFHQPVNQIRLGNYDENNNITTAYLNTDWRNATNTNTVEIKMFGSEQPKIGERYLMYFKEYDVDELYYPIPKYFSAANWILADALLSKYYVNTAANGFTPSTVITYPSEIEQDKKEALYNMLIDNYGGPENAGSVMLLFGDNGVNPTVQALNASTNPDLYKDFSAEVLSKIISANRLPSPTLAGISSPSNLGGASNELLTAFILYNLTVVHQIRKFVLEKMNYLLKLNGLPKVLNIMDFNLRDELEGNTKENDEKERESIDVDEEEIIEDENNGVEE